MSNRQPQMSRRDWFRLRPAAPQKKLGAKKQDGLKSIEEPVNHGNVDLSALPPMHEATLDEQEVTSLFSDLEKHGIEIQLIVRSATTSTLDQSTLLSLARDQLLSGNVRKMQIRYQWDNAHWIDTLERLPLGFRLVRIQHRQF